MKKTILAGALSIACLTGGFGLQAQAQENVGVTKIVNEQLLVASTNTSQVQSMSYQDIYKMLLLSKLDFTDDQMTLVSTSNSITVKLSLASLMESYKDGTNLYPEGEKEFKENFEEYKKIFGDSIQMKLTQSGKAFKAEIYIAGKWEAVSGQDLNDLIMIFNRANFELKPGGYFTDTIGHWAESYIQLLYQAEIVSGTTDTTFNPNGQVTRGQLAAMIFRASGLDVNEDYEGPATYKDMQGFWGAKEVAILQEYGLIDIFDGNNFEPNKPATREEMAYVTASYLEGMEFDVAKASKNNTFTDKDQMRKETVESIGLLQQLGIIDGANGKFNPKGNLTRGQFSKILSLTLITISEE
ncbi:S-layer homology domain-containing protein [Lysinibacillus sp. NPDC048646]|uniref:S-layer homology domain-containing protein n=1 Tax=Lysinibacillus sp. NPDC048646 TaxID=3390574 RepID=UPI003CFFF78D